MRLSAILASMFLHAAVLALVPASSFYARPDAITVELAFEAPAGSLTEPEAGAAPGENSDAAKPPAAPAPAPPGAAASLSGAQPPLPARKPRRAATPQPARRPAAESATAQRPSESVPPAVSRSRGAPAERNEEHRGGSVVVLHRPPPAYPYAARLQGVEGRVLVRVAVGGAGAPTSVEILSSSGSPMLDDSAVASVRRWRFGPLGGNTEIDVPIEFRLDD